LPAKTWLSARAQVGHVLRRLQRRELRLAALAVLERLPVERADVVAFLLVEAGARLLAQQPRSTIAFMKSGP
jgi:hypothetical protein